MKLSIVITTRNRKSDLIDCVESIKRSTRLNFEWELVIVDDCSNDWTEYLTINDFWISNGIVIHNIDQKMMVRSRNIWAMSSKWEYILYIDDDNIIDENMIANLIDFADKNNEFWIIGPSMYFLNSKEKYLDFQNINLFTWRTLGGVDNSKAVICETDWIPNVFMIRKKIFEECWYFDEKLVQTFTEPDFAFNAKKYWFRCCILKSAITYHNILSEDIFTPRALGWKFNQKAYCLMRNRTLIVKRYWNLPQKLVYILFFSWLRPLLYSLLILKHKRFDLIKLYWRGFYDWLIYFFTGKLNDKVFQKLNNIP